MVKARKYVVKNHFQGLPKKTDFEVVEYDTPPLKTGEILVKVEYVSVDPYQRFYNTTMKVPYDQSGFQVGEVIESKNPKYPVGCKMVTSKGWADYSITSEEIEDPLHRIYKVPDLKGLPITTALSVVSMVGATAYFGLLEICNPKQGETVVVTGAAGAVGSIVGQIAKIKGCKVIGFAGSDEKVNWLEKEVGFDIAFNYKTVDAEKALKEAAPEGIDCYFDNVGGELSSIIMKQMNMYGRVSACGSISAYNDTTPSKASVIQPAIVFKQLKVQGFLVRDYGDRWPEAFQDLVKWVKEGKIVVKEKLTVGLDNVYDAFIGMLAGDNTGKAIVKV